MGKKSFHYSIKKPLYAPCLGAIGASFEQYTTYVLRFIRDAAGSRVFAAPAE